MLKNDTFQQMKPQYPCSVDLFPCNDGSFVTRNTTLYCEFNSCALEGSPRYRTHHTNKTIYEEPSRKKNSKNMFLNILKKKKQNKIINWFRGKKKKKKQKPDRRKPLPSEAPTEEPELVSLEKFDKNYWLKKPVKDSQGNLITVTPEEEAAFMKANGVPQ